MKVFVMLLLASLIGMVRASSLPVEMHDESDVARVALAAQRTVFVSAPQLRSRAVADALRRAAVGQGVRVLILCDADRVLERGGFIASLSLLHPRYPLEVRVLNGVSSPSLIVDEARSVSGALVAQPWTFGLAPTWLDLEPGPALARARRFWSQWQRARPWAYRVQNPSFSSPGGAK